MSTHEFIKAQIKNLFETNPYIHMDVAMTHPKLILKNESVKITGVYRNIFQIEENSSGSPKRHTLQYSDIITGSIAIKELK